jgi:hypothetical protein
MERTVGVLSSKRFRRTQCVNCLAAALHPVYVRGLAYLRLGQEPQAAAEFQKVIDHSGIVVNEPIGVGAPQSGPAPATAPGHARRTGISWTSGRTGTRTSPFSARLAPSLPDCRRQAGGPPRARFSHHNRRAKCKGSLRSPLHCLRKPPISRLKPRILKPRKTVPPFQPVPTFWFPSASIEFYLPRMLPCRKSD